jgi:hypothetical protein
MPEKGVAAGPEHGLQARDPRSLPSQEAKFAISGVRHTEIEPLASDLKAEKRTLRQIVREGLIAIYELGGAGGVRYGYEVIVIKIAKAQEIFGRSYPRREVYPSDEEWGSRAWSYPRNGLETAREHFKGLVAEHKQKEAG